MAAFCKADPELAFDNLMCLSGVDYPKEKEPRMEVVYHLYSIPNKERIRIKAPVAETDCTIDSACALWNAADWLEREVYDLMGVRFAGHPDLRRIMLPEDFEGHPLRKEYPMEGDDEWRNYLPPEGREP